MKLFCIKDFTPLDKTFQEMGRPSPVFSEECEVLQSTQHCGDTFYQLAGRFHPSSGFRSDHFAILPEQSADEMSEEKREAIANLENKPA